MWWLLLITFRNSVIGSQQLLFAPGLIEEHLATLVVYVGFFSGPGFYPTFLLLVISANLLTYSQFLCASVCSALTTSLVGVGKSVIQTIIGFFTFGGVHFHPLNVAGKSIPTQLTTLNTLQCLIGKISLLFIILFPQS